MKILIDSPKFYPSVGGLETVISILAHEFVSLGHEVKLISKVPSIDSKHFPFEVIRQPNAQKILELTSWCHIFFQGCVSLKDLWALLIVHRPLAISHHTWYRRSNGSYSWQDHIKQNVTTFACNISVSSAVAEQIAGKSVVIHNPYREDIFYKIPENPRDKELIYLGRLVSDKGVDLLLDALAHLKTVGLYPKLTIVGSGSEEFNLRQKTIDLDLIDQVEFTGVKFEHELAMLLNSHHIMVVPSRWQEPFGVVALEGIACGCVVIGSEGGGLKEAIGSCGVTFPNGDVQALTNRIIELLTNPKKLESYRLHAETHLSIHKKEKIAEAYLQVFERAMQ